MALKINQSVSKDAQARDLLKELIKMHQVHQAYIMITKPNFLKMTLF